MSLIYLHVDYGRTFVPFRLKKEAATVALSCLGGDPPIGIRPKEIHSCTRYFATLGLEEGCNVSLFTSFDYESRQSPFNFFRGTYKLYNQSNAAVQFVVHKQGIKSGDELALKSELPRLGFVFESPGMDPECATIESLGNPEIYTEHKVGGLPSFGQLEGDVGAALALLRDGYVHILQLASPSIKDTLFNADWPFGEAVFHVFSKKTGAGFEFRYIWA